MRLTADEVAAIKRSAHAVFGADVLVRLFGSRLDDQRRGGDIDLFVQVPDAQSSVEAAARFRRLLDQSVGERDYDIIVAHYGQPISPVGRKAMTEGVVL